MRILCVTNLFPNPLQPGKGIFNWRQLRAMSQRASVRVISPVFWTDALSGLMRGRRFSSHPVWREWEGVEVAYCRYYYTPGICRNWYGTFFQWSIQRLFRQAVADFHPELVYACWAYPDGWAASRLAKEYGLPTVVKLHGSDLLLMDEFRGRTKGTVELLKNAHATIAVGETLRKAAIAHGAPAERACVVHEGTDLELFCPGDRTEARRRLGLSAEGQRVLFVGNLVPVKGVRYLIEACERLKRNGLAVHADLLGDGPLELELRRHIEALGLRDCIHLHGRKAQTELPQWYRAADLVVLPSRSEGIPNVLVEAAACGTPFVATRVGGVPEIAHLTPHPLVDSGDADALARSIQTALADSTSQRTIPRPRRSTEDCVDEIMDVFENVVTRGSPVPGDAVPQVALAQHQ